MKSCAWSPCVFFVDQCFNLHANELDELYDQKFVIVVARALKRARFPHPKDDWVLWYASWKAMTPIPPQEEIPKRKDVEILDWGLAIPFFKAASDRGQATRWAKRTLAVLRRNRALVARQKLV